MHISTAILLIALPGATLALILAPQTTEVYCTTSTKCPLVFYLMDDDGRVYNAEADVPGLQQVKICAMELDGSLKHCKKASMKNGTYTRAINKFKEHSWVGVLKYDGIETLSEPVELIFEEGDSAIKDELAAMKKQIMEQGEKIDELGIIAKEAGEEAFSVLIMDMNEMRASLNMLQEELWMKTDETMQRLDFLQQQVDSRWIAGGYYDHHETTEASASASANFGTFLTFGFGFGFGKILPKFGRSF